jgi:iron-chelate-transporting ATPase
VLKPLSLTLAGPGVTGLIGQNGSGKSTLLKILARQHGVDPIFETAS